MAVKTVPEQRKASRVDLQAHVEIDIPSPHSTPTALHLEANSLNLSEGGMCLRLKEALEIRSQVRLKLFPAPSKKPLECAGRVAWVVQRLDLRDSPPFVYDIGLEFIDPSPRLRQFASRAGVHVRAVEPVRRPLLEPAVFHERRYLPRLDREAVSGLWHLIIWVDGVPCFSHRYPMQREGVAAWERFKRQLAAQRPRPAKAPTPPTRKRVARRPGRSARR